MEVQQALNFEHSAQRSEALRVALQPYGLPHWSVELIIMLACVGRPREIAGQRCYELEISKRKAGQAMGCAANTFVRAATHLQHLGVLEVVSFGRQRTYYLSADRVNSLAPIADNPVDELGLFERPPPYEDAQSGPRWSTVVHGGPSARVRESNIYISRDVNRVPCNRVHGRADQSLTTANQPSLRDLTDSDVATLDLPALRSAYLDAVDQGWLEDSHEDKRKFLAACHHAANSKGVHHPARVVYAAVKRYEFERVGQKSWDWAGEFLRQRERQRLEESLDRG